MKVKIFNQNYDFIAVNTELFLILFIFVIESKKKLITNKLKLLRTNKEENIQKYFL
jgi:hypothetical protein